MIGVMDEVKLTLSDLILNDFQVFISFVYFSPFFPLIVWHVSWHVWKDMKKIINLVYLMELPNFW